MYGTLVLPIMHRNLEFAKGLIHAKLLGIIFAGMDSWIPLELLSLVCILCLPCYQHRLIVTPLGLGYFL